MKKIALYILFAVFLKSSIVFAQDSIPIKRNRKLIYGVNVSGSVSHYVGGIANISAVITSNTKCRHSLYLGTMFNLEYGGGFGGIQGAYMFFPNLKQKRFDFCFFYDVKHEEYSKQEYYWQHTIGYGFRFNIIHNLYVNSNIGVGNTIIKTKAYPGIFDQYNYFSGMFVIGIGYNL